jgi:predicted dehydrogenase
MYEKEMINFVESILKNKPTFASPLDGLKAMEAATAAERSSEKGEMVKLPLIEY